MGDRGRGRGLQVVTYAGRDDFPRAMAELEHAGSVQREKRRFALEGEREGVIRDDADRVIELIAMKRTGRFEHESPVAALLSDYTLQTLCERVLTHLMEPGDRGQWGEGKIVWQSFVLPEAAFALCAEAERRGLVPHEQVEVLVAKVEEYQARFRTPKVVDDGSD